MMVLIKKMAMTLKYFGLVIFNDLVMGLYKKNMYLFYYILVIF